MSLGPRGRWVFLLAAVSLVATITFVVRRARRLPVEPRAAWVWSDHVMRDAGARDSLFAWARRHRIGRLYQHVEPLLLEDPEAVAAFLRHARSDGLIVEALLGDPAWIAAPDSAMVRIDRLLGMHDRLGSDTLAALHLDVEPHGLPDWTRRRAETVVAFQVLMERVGTRRGGRTIPIHLDIPSWYNEVTLPGDSSASLAAWLFPRVEGVTVMAYLTDVARLQPAVAGALALAGRHGTAITVGVETGCGVDAAFSFCTLGRARLEQTLAGLHSRYGGDGRWQGTAIHFYPAATALLP